MIAEKLYRYDADCLGDVSIFMREFEIKRHTLKGVWIFDGWQWRDRWVSLTGRKRFAYPTEEEAMKSFKIRKEKQKKHLDRQQKDVTDILDMLEKGETNRSRVNYHIGPMEWD